MDTFTQQEKEKKEYHFENNCILKYKTFIYFNVTLFHPKVYKFWHLFGTSIESSRQWFRLTDTNLKVSPFLKLYSHQQFYNFTTENIFILRWLRVCQISHSWPRLSFVKQEQRLDWVSISLIKCWFSICWSSSCCGGGGGIKLW